MKKSNKIWICFLSSLLMLYCCEREVDDHRNPFLGEFNFTTISNTKSQCYASSENCVNGWMSYNFDTVCIKTCIELNGGNELKIQFGNGVLGQYNDSVYTQIIYPELLPDGNLYLPDYPQGGHNSFDGRFVGYDTLLINFQFGFLIGGYEEYRVIGIRNR